MNLFQLLITKIGLFFLYFLVSAPVLLPLMKVADAIEQRHELRILAYAIQILVVAYYLGCMWLANRAATKMTLENLSLRKATTASLYDARLYLAFLPIVGGLFEPRDKGEDDKRRLQ